MRRAASSRDDRRNETPGLPESKSDAAWKAMTAIEADEADRWTEVEEHLVQPHDGKRWKYFSK